MGTHTIIDLAFRELSSRSNNTPNDTRRAEDLSCRTNEAILLIAGAYIRNIGEHPRLYAKLRGPCNDSGDNLCPEHGSGQKKGV
jgi:hypothetical protein